MPRPPPSTTSAAATISAAKILRAIGDPALRFAEDKLRMLRAVRFAARLDFEIEPRTMAAIRRRRRADRPGQSASASATN